MIYPHKVLLFVVCWFGLLTPVACGQSAPRVDQYDDPLPEGALARLGTLLAFAFQGTGTFPRWKDSRRNDY